MSEQITDLKGSAINFGFEQKWIDEVLTSHGVPALAASVELARTGMSIELVAELLQRFGSAMLQFLIDVTNHSAANNFSLGSPLDASLDIIVPLMIEKYLPNFIDQYGTMVLDIIKQNPQIVRPLIQALLNSIGKKA